MAHKLRAEEWESYYLCDNGIGLVDIPAEHVPRAAEIISERYPGFIILWTASDKGHRATLNAVRPNKRAISRKQEEKMVAAAEVIARNVANKHPIKSGFFASLMRKNIRQGWHYTEPSEA